MHGRRLSCSTPGRSRNGRRAPAAFPRARIQGSWLCCATPRGALFLAVLLSAVAYLRRALAEPPSAAERADLLLELGSAEALVRGDAAVEHLREAHALTVDPVRRAETALVLGRELFLLLRSEESDAVFTEALDELAGADTELERLLEAGLITNAMLVRQLYRAASRGSSASASGPGDRR